MHPMTPGLRLITRCLIFLTAICAQAHADTATVNTLSNNSNGVTTSIAALIASPGSDGKISLREAIRAANNTPGHDDIIFTISGIIGLGSDLDPLTDNAGVTIAGGGNVILNRVNQSGEGIIGITIASANNLIAGLVIVNLGTGIVINGDNNSIHGCLIGTTGVVIGGNIASGVIVESGVGNMIGGVDPGDGNVISGNAGGGIITYPDATYTLVQGNIIGMNAAGTAALGNTGEGIVNQANNTIIGGATEGARNYISGNAAFGIITFGFDTVIAGNYIGTNKAGTAAVGNGGLGILASGGSTNIHGNVISGNSAGIQLGGVNTLGSRITGNVIGLAADRVTPLGRMDGGGIWILGMADVQIGDGSVPGSGNIIAACGYDGIHVRNAKNIRIESNIIGTDETTTRDLGNSHNGIFLEDSVNCTIGNTGSGSNIILNNGHSGVLLFQSGPAGNVVSGNQISNNQYSAIANSAHAEIVQPPTAIGLTPLFGTASPGAIIEIFADTAAQARTYIGSTITGINGVFTYSGNLTPFLGLNITLTARDANGDTSPLSDPFPTGGSDSDGDGLTDTDETSEYVTDPERADTDEDGIVDGREVLAGLDPLDASDGEVDPDGDGLPNADELNVRFTNAFNADTDSDGMADGFEALHRLLPRNATDANTDHDGDVLTNIEEYARRSNPRDSDSPTPTIFIDNNGVDTIGRGQRSTPYQTIEFALTQFTSSVDTPVRVVLAQGEYSENIVMQPGLVIAGELAPSGAKPTINGNGPVVVEGAEAAQIVNLRIAQPNSAEKNFVTLLQIADVQMLVDRVAFQGDWTRNAVGINITGDVPQSGVISNCILSSLAMGIHVTGAVPTIRKNVFDDIVPTGILIQEGAKSDYKNLGIQNDPNSGYNTFSSTVQNAVTNETANTLDMQMNDWGTNVPSEVAARVIGPATTTPFLPSGSGVLSATLTCYVWDTDSLAPVTNATIGLTGDLDVNTTDNVTGTYRFASLPAGDFTMTISATDYESSGPLAITLASAQVATQSYALTPIPLAMDSDGDGLSDAEETGELGTDPDLRDTDDDSLNDDVETAYGGNPNVVELARTSDINADGAINAVDVQLIINGALVLPLVGNADVDRNGEVDATDVQTVILIALDASTKGTVTKFIPIDWHFGARLFDLLDRRNARPIR